MSKTTCMPLFSPFRFVCDDNYAVTVLASSKMNSADVRANYGIVISWFLAEDLRKIPDTEEMIETGYGYAVCWETSGTVDTSYVFTPPDCEDGRKAPRLSPRVIIPHGTASLVLYDDGICTIVQSDGSFVWGRID